MLGLGCCYEGDPDLMIVVVSGRQIQEKLDSRRLIRAWLGDYRRYKEKPVKIVNSNAVQHFPSLWLSRVHRAEALVAEPDIGCGPLVYLLGIDRLELHLYTQHPRC